MSDPDVETKADEKEVKQEILENVSENRSKQLSATKLSFNKPLTLFSDEAYACDRQNAIVLAQLISVSDREKVYKWIKKLDTMNSCTEMRESRSDYLRFLILSVRHGKLVPPFTKLPPPALRPLSTIMPKSVSNLIYKGKYTTGDCGPDEDLSMPIYGPPEVVVPSSFFSRQPVPRNGGMVYAAAFSNR